MSLSFSMVSWGICVAVNSTPMFQSKHASQKSVVSSCFKYLLLQAVIYVLENGSLNKKALPPWKFINVELKTLLIECGPHIEGWGQW